MNQLIKDVLGIKSKDKLENKDIFNLPIKSITNIIQGTDDKYKILGRVSPINGELMSGDNLDVVFDAIAGALASFDGRIGIYVQSERVDIEANLNSIDKRKIELNSEFKIMLLEEQKKHLAKLANKTRNVLNFYVCLEIDKANNYVAAETILLDAFNNFKNELEASEMYLDRVHEAEIKSILYERLNPEQSQIEPIQEDWSIKNILPQNAKIFKDGRHIEIESALYRFFAITKYPSNVDNYRWLRRMFKVNGNINIAIILTPKNKTKINKELDNAAKEAQAKANNPSVSATLKDQYTKEYESSLQMISELGSDNISLYDTNITIGISSKDMESLNTLATSLRAAISSTMCQSTEIRYKGFDGFFTTLPILADNKITRNYVWNLSTKDVASIIPFDSSEFMEKKGILMGENAISQGLVICDYNNKMYNNGHLTIVADSGSGKTFFIYCDAIRNIPYVDYTIMFDIKGDLFFPWGKRYVFNPKSNIRTNPFHMRNAIVDSESDYDNGNIDVGSALASKIMDLIVFFRWIMPDMTPYDEALLEEDIRSSYKSVSLDFDSTKLPESFPTMETLAKIQQSKIDDEKANEREVERRIYMKSSLKPYTEGAYSKMFNGQTNWEFDFFTVFDISQLPEAIRKPMYDILLKDTWAFCKKDGTQRPTLKRVYVDECHEFADPKNPQTLEFISVKLSKQGRGFGVKLVTATQNLPDFLSIPRFGQAIIDNAFFKLFMRLGESDLPVAQKLYRFSDPETKILHGSTNQRKGSKGKGIFMIGSQRVVIQVRASEFELEIIDPEQYQELYKRPSRYNKGKIIEVN